MTRKPVSTNDDNEETVLGMDWPFALGLWAATLSAPVATTLGVLLGLRLSPATAALTTVGIASAAGAWVGKVCCSSSAIEGEYRADPDSLVAMVAVGLMFSALTGAAGLVVLVPAELSLCPSALSAAPLTAGLPVPAPLAYALTLGLVIGLVVSSTCMFTGDCIAAAMLGGGLGIVMGAAPATGARLAAAMTGSDVYGYGATICMDAPSLLMFVLVVGSALVGALVFIIWTSVVAG